MNVKLKAGAIADEVILDKSCTIKYAFCYSEQLDTHNSSFFWFGSLFLFEAASKLCFACVLSANMKGISF